MYKSGLLNGLSRSSKSDLTLNDTKNDVQQSFILPKITSTPLQLSHNRESSITPTRINNLSLNSKRYSLSDVNITPPYRGDSSRYNSPSTTRYNPNTSTYVNVQSPGFAGRIVQYNNEEKEKFQTHNPKYSRPGTFPIVHLFKKDVPIIKPKPSKVTVRIGPTDLSKYNSPEHNRMLLERIIQTTPKNRQCLPTQNSEEVSTRSVLDALKEISRKRIHASEEEYEQNEESGKRIRMDYLNGSGDVVSNKNKRTRDELSPKLDESINDGNRVTKKMCSFNELLASETSMELPIKDGNKKKRNLSVSSNTSPEIVKHSKLIDVETQTTLPELTKTTITEPVVPFESTRNDIVKNIDNGDKQKLKEKSPIKVFDEKPLEMMRRNRLNILMRSFCNKEIPEDLEEENEEEADTNQVNINVTTNSDKPLVSILATPNKSPRNKHVQFDIPENKQQSSVVTTKLNENLKPTFSITQTSTAVVTPLMSVSESSKTNLEVPPPIPTPEVKTTSTTFSLPVTSGNDQQINKLTFGFGSNSVKTTEKPNSSTVTSTITSTVSMPIFSFSSQTAKPVSTAASAIEVPKSLSVSSPQKIGGFKFDVTKPTAVSIAVTSAAVPTFSFNSTNSNNQKNTSVPTFSFGNKSSSESDFSFGTEKKTQDITNKSFELTKTTSALNVVGQTTFSGFSLTPTTSFVSANTSFNITPQSTASITKLENEKSTTVVTPANSENKPQGFSFAINKTATTTTPSFVSTTISNVTFGNTSFSTTVSSIPIFSSKSINSTTAMFGNTTTSVPSFDNSVINNVTSNAPVTTSSSTFGNFTSNISFGNTKPPTFGGTTNTVTFGNTTSTQAFTNTTVALTFGGTTSTPTFGTATTTLASIPLFGSTNSTATFGTTKTSPAAFGGSNLSTVFGGTTTALPFNATTTASAFSTTTTAPAFSATTTAPPAYGSITSSAAFANTTSAPTFGGSAVTPTFGANSSGNTFGNSTSATAFGGTSSTTFGGTTAAPMFGNTTTTPSFGSVTAAPTFGSNSSTVTFGGSTTSKPAPNFGSSSSGFGNSSFDGNNTKSSFGLMSTANSPMFGSNSTATVTSSSFGVPISTPSFRANFNTNTPNQMFGTTTVTTSTFSFSTASKPLFGNVNTTLPFASTSATTTTTTPNIFGATTNTVTPSFGTNNSFSTSSGFGQSSNNINTFGSTGNVSTFGAAIPTTTAPPPAFGTNTVFSANNSFGTPTPNFGTPTTTTSAFGAPAAVTPGFGAPVTAAPAFGTATTSTFGAPAKTAPTFGAPTTTAPTFGTPVTTASAFGATNNTFSSPNFGNSTFKQTQNNFAVPTTQNNGVFTFGSATTAQKPFAFGAAEPPKPNFNFNATPTNFTGNAAPAFGSVPTPQFGIQAPQTGMFNIGAGTAPSGRPRTQLKAKRRT